jgi:hypothetical protein
MATIGAWFTKAMDAAAAADAKKAKAKDEAAEGGSAAPSKAPAEDAAAAPAAKVRGRGAAGLRRRGGRGGDRLVARQPLVAGSRRAAAESEGLRGSPATYRAAASTVYLVPPHAHSWDSAGQ